LPLLEALREPEIEKDIIGGRGQALNGAACGEGQTDRAAHGGGASRMCLAHGVNLTDGSKRRRAAIFIWSPEQNVRPDGLLWETPVVVVES